MWERLSLRTRLLLPLGLMFLAALIAGGASLQIFATAQLMEETEPTARSARAVAAALNGALRVSTNPQATLEAFVQSLGSSEAIRFRRLGTDLDAHPPEVQTPLGTVPDWFVSLIAIPELNAAFPVTIEGKHVGDIVFAPDVSAQIYEKWIGFLAIVGSGITLMLLTGAIAHFTARSALRPLQSLGEGLTRMRTGDYEQLISPAGPPEIRKSAQEANELARTLNRLSQDNRRLLRRIVSLQDDERRDVARELHDELGPLLFGIRANSVALLESAADGGQSVQRSAQRVMESAEALQQANRKILDRLRPLHIEELGLDASIRSLVRDARSHLPQLKVTSDIAPSLKVDSVVSQTIYRVIQESVTNVLRHARASELGVKASSEREHILVEVSDDGIGITPDLVFGRGLTGMRERVRALGGTLQLARESGRTFVRCRLPVIASE